MWVDHNPGYSTVLFLKVDNNRTRGIPAQFVICLVGFNTFVMHTRTVGHSNNCLYSNPAYRLSLLI